MKVYTPTNANLTLLTRLVFAFRERNVANYLKLKKDDRLSLSSGFWARIRLETFMKVRPEPGRTYNSGVKCKNKKLDKQEYKATFCCAKNKHLLHLF